MIVLLLIVCLTASASAAQPQDGEPLRLPIVMYHHVSRHTERCNDYVVSEAELRADLEWLRAHGYETVSTAQLSAWAEGMGTLPKKPCMITFDDGFESVLAYAEPLLREYGFCAAAAVIGSVCEQFSALQEHDPELSNLSWEDAAALAQRGTVEIICHTWNMHVLWPRSGCSKRAGESTLAYRYTLSTDLSRFLTESRNNGLPPVTAIAYPYGSFCRETTEAARDFGFCMTFTCEERVNCLTRTGEALYNLGRYNRPHGISSEKFFSAWEETA